VSLVIRKTEREMSKQKSSEFKQSFFLFSNDE